MYHKFHKEGRCVKLYMPCIIYFIEVIVKECTSESHLAILSAGTDLCVVTDQYRITALKVKTKCFSHYRLSDWHQYHYKIEELLNSQLKLLVTDYYGFQLLCPSPPLECKCMCMLNYFSFRPSSRRGNISFLVAQ